MFSALHHWFKHRSLTFRLGVSISACIFIGVIWLWFYLAQHSRPIIRSHIESLARHPLYNVVRDITDTGWETQSTAMTIKNTLKELPSTNVDMMRHLLHSAMQTLIHDNSDAAHAWVYVFEDEDVTVGTMYAATMVDGKFNFSTKKISNFYKLYPWFKAVPKEEKIFWSEPYVAEEFSQQNLVSTCLIPFKFVGSEQFDGLVAVSADLDVIRNNIREVESSGVGKYWLVSPTGWFILHPNLKFQNKTSLSEMAKDRNMPQLEQIYADLKAGKAGSIEIPASSVFDSDVMVFYAPVEDWNLGVGLVFSKKQFFEPVEDLRIKTLTSILFGLLAMLLLVNLICRRSTKPLLDLSKIALQYGEGDFSAALPENVSNDEIGVMTSAFGKMRDNLQQYITLVKTAASEKQRGESELQIAQKIQKSALPLDFPLHQAFEIYASMDSAKKVGGDFYDFFFVDNQHFAIVIADVSGKGIPAALYMMNAKALIRSVAKAEKSAAKIFEIVNNELCNGGADMFVTAFMAILELKTGQMKYVNAGHNPPFYYNGKHYKKLKVKHNIILGGLPDMKFKAESLTLKAGNRIFLYTDGVNEAQNNSGGFYGDERLEKTLNQELQSPFDTLLQVKNSVLSFANGAEQSDDMTMLELLYCGDEKNTFVTEAEVKNIDKVLNFVEQDTVAKNISQEAQNRVMVITEEITSNISQYAYRNNGILRLQTSIKNGEYHLTFKDNGKEFNPLKCDEPDVTLSAEEREIGGLGIYLIHKLASSVEYKRQNGQNILDIGVKI